MLKAILFAVILFGTTQQTANAETEIDQSLIGEYTNEKMYGYIGRCHNIEASPFGFESCMNRVFGEIETEVSVTISNCFGLKSSPFSYENCVNKAFKRVQNKMDISLGYCAGAEYAPHSFQSCINRNFSKIEDNF